MHLSKLSLLITLLFLIAWERPATYFKQKVRADKRVELDFMYKDGTLTFLQERIVSGRLVTEIDEPTSETELLVQAVDTDGKEVYTQTVREPGYIFYDTLVSTDPKHPQYGEFTGGIKKVDESLLTIRLPYTKDMERVKKIKLWRPRFNLHKKLDRFEQLTDVSVKLEFKEPENIDKDKHLKKQGGKE